MEEQLLINNHKEYKQKYMREYRQRKKQEKEQAVSTTEIKITENTREQYIRIITRNHILFATQVNSDLEDILRRLFTDPATMHTSDLPNIKRWLQYVNLSFPAHMREKYPNENSLKVYLTPYTKMLAILSTIDESFKKKHSFYSQYIMDLHQRYEYERDNNEVSDEDANKIITDFTTPTILSNMEKLETTEEKLIYGLYTLLPPRRLEYAGVVLITEGVKYKMKDNTNYLIMKKRTPDRFVWNNYKTSNTFGRIEVEIPEELKSLLLSYIKENKLKTHDAILDYKKANFVRIITNIFNKVYEDANITVRWVRISYATYLNSLNISNNEREKIAIKMGHGVVQSSKYRKVLSDSD
tara:strand:- start:5915 stop:6976 length:1062 start_codon:yes stop_codon:yes gene_type:complete